MMKLIFVNIIIVFFAFPLYSQSNQTETQYLDSIIKLEYPVETKKYNLLRLDTINSEENDYIRIWSAKQIVTLKKSNNGIYTGEIINHIEKRNSSKKKYKKKIIKRSELIPSDKVETCFKKFIEIDLKSIPTGYQLHDWVAVDGVTYIFESLTQGYYEKKIYSSPSLFEDSVIYKNKILELVGYFEEIFETEYDHFFNKLPRGTYVIINEVYKK